MKTLVLILSLSISAQQADPRASMIEVPAPHQWDMTTDASGHALMVSPAAGLEAADPVAAVTSPTDQMVVKYYDYLLAKSDGYYNEFYRYFAIHEAAKGRWKQAAILFEIAARYADKYSQHRLSLMYWHGVGVEKDLVMGYVWADIAAERGYIPMLAIREKMWEAMTPEQQGAVAQRGPPLYAIYGDPEALRKFRGIFARKRFVHNAYVAQNGLGRIDRLHADRYLAQERGLYNARITVGEIESANDKPAPASVEPTPPPRP